MVFPVCSPRGRAVSAVEDDEEVQLVCFSTFLDVIQRAHRDNKANPRCASGEAETASTLWSWLQEAAGSLSKRACVDEMPSSLGDAQVEHVIEKLKRVPTGLLKAARRTVLDLRQMPELTIEEVVRTLADWAAGEGVDKDPPSATADDVADRPSRECSQPPVLPPPARPDAARTIGTPLSSPFPVTGAATTLNDARTWPLSVFLCC